MPSKNTLFDTALITRGAETTNTVAKLNANAPIGSADFVTDANSTTFAAVAVGGGANAVPVYKDAAGWKVG